MDSPTTPTMPAVKTEWRNVGNIIPSKFITGKDIAFLNNVNLNLLIDHDNNVMVQGAPDENKQPRYMQVSKIIPASNGTTGRIPIFGTTITVNLERLAEMRSGQRDWVQIAIPKKTVGTTAPEVSPHDIPAAV